MRLFLLLLLCLPFFSSAQEEDSLLVEKQIARAMDLYKNDSSVALRILDSTMAYIHAGEFDFGRARLLLTKAEIYQFYRKYVQVEALDKEALKIFERYGDVKTLAHVHGRVAIHFRWMYYNLGDDRLKEVSLQHYHLSSKLYESLNDIRGLAYNHFNRAVFYDDLGIRKKAIEQYDSAIYYFYQLEEPETTAECLNNVGSIHMALGNSYEAQRRFLEGEALAEAEGLFFQLIRLKLNRAKLYVRFKKLAEAEKLFNYCLEQAMEKNDSMVLSKVYVDGASIFIGTDSKLTEPVVKNGYEFHQSYLLNEERRRVLATILYGDFLREEGFVDEAIGKYEEALSILSKYDNRYYLKKLAGQIFYRRGQIAYEKKEYDQSLIYFRKANDLIEASTRYRDLDLLEVWLWIGKVYVESGQSNLALAILKRGYDRACSLENYYWKSQYLFELSRVYAQLGQTGLAMENLSNYQEELNQYHTYAYDSRALDIERELRITQDSLELALQQRQITNLKAEKERVASRAFIITLILIFSAVVFVMAVLLLRIRNQKKQMELKRKNDELKQEISEYARKLISKREEAEYLEEQLQKYQTIEVEHPEKILTSEDWIEFKNKFSKAYPNFFKQLHQDYKGLTEGDERLLALMKLNLSTRELALILGISPSSVKMAKYRLRKKLAGDSPIDLTEAVLKYG